MGYLYLILAWLGYFVIHSVLSMHQIKNVAYQKGISRQSYRLFFNIFALITLVPVLIISLQIPAAYVFNAGKIVKFLGLVLAAWGVILAKVAFRSYDTKAFLGLGPLNGEDVLHTDGMLKYVRHPLYTASILILIGYFLFDPKWTTCISVSMLIVYFIVGARFEERKLIRQFGNRYLEYKRKTPMLIPRLW